MILLQREEYKKSEQLLHLALKMAQDVQHHKAQRYVGDSSSP